MLFLMLGQARSRMAQAVLLKTREIGFLLALPTPEVVVSFIEALLGEDDEGLVLCFRTSADFETSRGRALGPLEVLLADFVWGGTEHFTRALSLRGAAERDLELSAFTSNARPVPVEYYTGEEEEEAEAPAVVDCRVLPFPLALLQGVG
eukprot:s1559_g16.t1